jgi:hypothetical protein
MAQQMYSLILLYDLLNFPLCWLLYSLGISALLGCCTTCSDRPLFLLKVRLGTTQYAPADTASLLPKIRPLQAAQDAQKSPLNMLLNSLIQSPSFSALFTLLQFSYSTMSNVCVLLTLNPSIYLSSNHLFSLRCVPNSTSKGSD